MNNLQEKISQLQTLGLSPSLQNRALEMLSDAYRAIESQEAAPQPLLHVLAVPVQVTPVFEIQPVQNAYFNEGALLSTTAPTITRKFFMAEEPE